MRDQQAELGVDDPLGPYHHKELRDASNLLIYSASWGWDLLIQPCDPLQNR